MRLVIDTNILFSLFKNSYSFTKFIKNNNIELYAPFRLLGEINKYSERICSMSGLSQKDLNTILNKLPDIISFCKISNTEIENALKYISDPKDAPFLALALNLNIPIWSEDAHFKKQKIARSFNFKELKDFLEKSK